MAADGVLKVKMTIKENFSLPFTKYLKIYGFNLDDWPGSCVFRLFVK